MASSAPRMYKGCAKFLAYANNAKPNPKLGQALGPLGLNMNQVCKEFNERTTTLRPDVPMRIQLYAYSDRTYYFIIKPPPTSWFLKRVSMMPKGHKATGRHYLTDIGVKYIYEIAKIKKAFDPHLGNHPLIGICKMIIAQANVMGFRISYESPPPEPIIVKKLS